MSKPELPPERSTSDVDGPDLVGPAPDGLDLARSLARSVARSVTGQRPALGTRDGTSARKRKRKPPAPGSGRVSGAYPDERDPQTLDTTVGRLVEDYGWAVDLRVQGIFGRWAELLGEDVARHCRPESFAAMPDGGGTLVVRTDSTAWATQMRLLAPTVVRRLNQELGDGTVAIISVLPPHGPTWKKGPRSVRDGRGPRDTYG
jgi:predicted nucleic acid-binding Zn ribbon protein